MVSYYNSFEKNALKWVGESTSTNPYIEPSLCVHCSILIESLYHSVSSGQDHLKQISNFGLTTRAWIRRTSDTIILAPFPRRRLRRRMCLYTSLFIIYTDRILSSSCFENRHSAISWDMSSSQLNVAHLQSAYLENSSSIEPATNDLQFFLCERPSPECMTAAQHSMFSKSPASRHLRQLVRCRFKTLDGRPCLQEFSISSDDTSGLRTHLELVHRIPKPRRQRQIDCAWEGCLCTAQGSRGSRCDSKPSEHPAHVDNLAQHIWNTHLGFRFICERCGAARWSSAFARDRHRDGKRNSNGVRTGACTGRVPARCPDCCREFSSEGELEGHLSHGKCCLDGGAYVESYAV
jgi:hypothetical protein